jgi:hypothetical protein
MDLSIRTEQSLLPGFLTEHAALPQQVHRAGQQLVELLDLHCNHPVTLFHNHTLS